MKKVYIAPCSVALYAHVECQDGPTVSFVGGNEKKTGETYKGTDQEYVELDAKGWGSWDDNDWNSNDWDD